VIDRREKAFAALGKAIAEALDDGVRTCSNTLNEIRNPKVKMHFIAQEYFEHLKDDDKIKRLAQRSIEASFHRLLAELQDSQFLTVVYKDGQEIDLDILKESEDVYMDYWNWIDMYSENKSVAGEIVELFAKSDHTDR